VPICISLTHTAIVVAAITVIVAAGRCHIAAMVAVIVTVAVTVMSWSLLLSSSPPRSLSSSRSRSSSSLPSLHCRSRSHRCRHGRCLEADEGCGGAQLTGGGRGWEDFGKESFDVDEDGMPVLNGQAAHNSEVSLGRTQLKWKNTCIPCGSPSASSQRSPHAQGTV
jgi:hypothetical protein